MINIKGLKSIANKMKEGIENVVDETSLQFEITQYKHYLREHAKCEQYIQSNLAEHYKKPHIERKKQLEATYQHLEDKFIAQSKEDLENVVLKADILLGIYDSELEYSKEKELIEVKLSDIQNEHGFTLHETNAHIVLFDYIFKAFIGYTDEEIQKSESFACLMVAYIEIDGEFLDINDLPNDLRASDHYLEYLNIDQDTLEDVYSQGFYKDGKKVEPITFIGTDGDFITIYR